MSRLMKSIGLALLFLVALLILVNIFVLMPRMRLAPVETVSAPMEKKPGAVRDDSIVAVDTLAVIKTRTVGEGGVYVDPEDESLRNPFFWPGAALQPQKTAAEPAPEQPRLSMVIIGEGRRQALLGDAFVREGDFYHGYLVKRIEEHQVVLVDDLGELRIFLAENTDESGKALESPGLMER